MLVLAASLLVPAFVMAAAAAWLVFRDEPVSSREDRERLRWILMAYGTRGWTTDLYDLIVKHMGGLRPRIAK